MINWNILKLSSLLFNGTRQQITIKRQITYTNILLKNKRENIVVFNFNKLKDIKKNEEEIVKTSDFEKKLSLEKKLNIKEKVVKTKKKKKTFISKSYVFQNKGENWESEKSTERLIKDKFKENNLICEIKGEKFYRVLGVWECIECNKKWSSSQTWILLEKWKDGTPFSKINEEDLLQQKCPKCNNENNRISLCVNLKEKDKSSKIKEKLESKAKKKPTKWLEDAIKKLENKKDTLSRKSLENLETYKKALQKINDQNSNNKN
ncbi:MAG: hypothetical protein AM1032_000130 [Mycoplasmataceae bacterium]|nr:MAG: hypothetical protein AM1032_000130 [Mycoplasmataceae bacterium]